MASNGKHRPIIISGYSSQDLAEEIATRLGSRVATVSRGQHPDKELDGGKILENVRGQEIVVVGSASGDPNKQEKEARVLMRSAKAAGATKVTLLLPYQYYGRSDGSWDERVAPVLYDTIEGLRQHCHAAIICDPHNQSVTQAKYTDGNSPVQVCQIVHFAFPNAIQLRSLLDQGVIDRTRLVFAHADAGATKRISRSYRECMYRLCGFAGRNHDQDDWPLGIKDHDKATGKIRVLDFSGDVQGKDVVVSEDMISGAVTANDLSVILKEKKGARSVTLFATSALLTHDEKKGEGELAAIERINRSALDAVFVSDTYNHRLTSPLKFEAMENSPIIHTVRTAPYLALVVQAMHAEVEYGAVSDDNSVLAILRGCHPAQDKVDQTIATPTPLKRGNPLLALKNG